MPSLRRWAVTRSPQDFEVANGGPTGRRFRISVLSLGSLDEMRAVRCPERQHSAPRRAIASQHAWRLMRRSECHHPTTTLRDGRNLFARQRYIAVSGRVKFSDSANLYEIGVQSLAVADAAARAEAHELRAMPAQKGWSQAAPAQIAIPVFVVDARRRYHCHRTVFRGFIGFALRHVVRRPDLAQFAAQRRPLRGKADAASALASSLSSSEWVIAPLRMARVASACGAEKTGSSASMRWTPSCRSVAGAGDARSARSRPRQREIHDAVRVRACASRCPPASRPRNSCCPSCRRGRFAIQSWISSACHAIVELRPPRGPSSRGSGNIPARIHSHNVEYASPPSSSRTCGLNISGWPGLIGASRVRSGAPASIVFALGLRIASPP